MGVGFVEDEEVVAVGMGIGEGDHAGSAYVAEDVYKVRKVGESWLLKATLHEINILDLD